MNVTYGTERECAIGGNSIKDSPHAQDALYRSIPSNGSGGTKYIGEGFSAYMDGGHIEITSPVSTDLQMAVATERRLDKIEGRLARKANCFAWKDNTCGGSFAVHDNYVFPPKSCNQELLDKTFNLMQTRQVVCGEGGIWRHGNFCMSPRTVVRRVSIIPKERRRRQVYSWDNCSVYSTAIRLGMLPCLMGLARLGMLKTPANERLLGLEICLSLDGPPPDIARRWAEEHAKVARQARQCLGDPRMPDGPGISKMIDLWEEAAESVAAGMPVLSIDWAAKREYLRRLPDNVNKEVALIEWSRIDRPGVFSKLEQRLTPDYGYWTKVSYPDKAFAWTITRRLPLKDGIRVSRENGSARSAYDNLSTRGMPADEAGKLKVGRHCVTRKGRPGKIVSVEGETCTVRLSRGGTIASVKPNKVFVY